MTHFYGTNNTATASYKGNVQISAGVLVKEDGALKILQITLIVEECHIALFVEGQGYV